MALFRATWQEAMKVFFSFFGDHVKRKEEKKIYSKSIVTKIV
jgi:hypothetical protein